MTNRAYLDYLRIGCWDDPTAFLMMAEIRSLGTNWRKSKWLQYDGWRTGGIFYGTGEQQGKRHYIFDVSGPTSIDLFHIAKDHSKCYATRIDVQVTIERPIDYDPHSTYELQKTISKRQSSLILSDSGSTIYFGNRTGDTFARLYEKYLDNQQFLRLEFEIKGIKARSIMMQMSQGLKANDVFMRYVKTIKMPDYIREWFTAPESGVIFWELEKIHSADKQLEWLSSLGNTVVRMGNDHYQGNAVKTILESWLKRIDIKGD
jgi:hypothetical protein